MQSGDIIFLLTKLPLVSVFVYTIIIILLYVDFYPNLASSYSLNSSNQKLYTVGNNISLPNKNNNTNLEILLFNNSSTDKIFDKLINLAKQTDDNNGIIKTLKDFAVPITVAIIGTTAALWNGFQAKWKGHHFQKLILRELGEFQPTNDKHKTYGNLKSYMKKRFIHEEIFHNSTENRDFILSLDPKLVYLTNQLWSSFDKNDVRFLKSLYDISKSRKSISKRSFDKKGEIRKACDEWIMLIGIEKALDKYKKPLTKQQREEFINNISDPEKNIKNYVKGDFLTESKSDPSSKYFKSAIFRS